jgi:hypothetical protein
VNLLSNYQEKTSFAKRRRTNSDNTQHKNECGENVVNTNISVKKA